MTRFIVRRAIQSVIVLFLIMTLSFILVHSAPGNFINPLEFPSGGGASGAEMKIILHNYGLDRPLYVQYGDYFEKLFRLDLGTSFKYHMPVTALIAQRLPATLELTVTAMIVGLVLGVVVGALAAMYRETAFDNVTRVLSVAGHAIPSFWLGLVLIWLGGVKLGWLPTGGIATVNATGWDLADRLKHLILPAGVLAFGLTAIFSRYMRGEMLEVLRQDYLRTARAKGIGPYSIILRHALRNAMIPVVTILGLELQFLFGGTVLIETVFAWPGMGRLIVNSAFGRDYPVILGTTLVAATLVIIGNFLADIVYAWIDPRIKLS